MCKLTLSSAKALSQSKWRHRLHDDWAAARRIESKKPWKPNRRELKFLIWKCDSVLWCLPLKSLNDIDSWFENKQCTCLIFPENDPQFIHTLLYISDSKTTNVFRFQKTASACKEATTLVRKEKKTLCSWFHKLESDFADFYLMNPDAPLTHNRRQYRY